MEKQKKILIFIDLEIILRHFIANDTFKELNKEYDVVYVFNQDRYDFKKDDIVKKNIDKRKIRTTALPRKRMGRWFYLYVVTVLRQQIGKKNFRARINLEFSRLGKRNVYLALIAGLPVFYHLFRYFFIKIMGVHTDINKIIKKEKPDLIIHPSILQGYFVNDLLRNYYKNKKSIPLIFLMNSWDNPSCKAFGTGSPTKLVVWGEQTKKYAIQYMKVNPKDIECFGAAQFEIYKKETPYNKEQLCRLFNADKNKKTILYAGAGNGRYEPIYLQLLDNYISEGYLPNCQIIYRPHPWRGGLAEGEEDFFSMKFQNIIMDPTMEDYYRQVIKEPRGVFLTDYKNSRDLMALADAVISPLSTMLLESILNGKPILMFFPEREAGSGYSTEIVHFSEFLELDVINKCFNESQFLNSCQRLYKQINDKNISSKLKEASSYFLTPSKISYGKQLKNLVKKYL